MRLRDFMTTDVETVSSKESAESAYDKMWRNHIHHLVVMQDNDIVGIISERDLGGLRIKPYTNIKGLLVEDLMAEDVVIAEPDTTVREAANMLRGQDIGCLPVLDSGRLVGIVTTTDLLDLLGQGIERIVADTEKRPITRESPGRKPAGFNPKQM